MRTTHVIVLALPLAACSPELAVVAGAPVFAAPPETLVVASEARISSLGVIEGAIVVGSDAGLLRVNETVLEPVELVTLAGEPAQSGAIVTLAARGDGVLALAENGLYYSYGARLVRSPTSSLVADLDVHTLDEAADGSLWLAGAELYRVAAALERWPLDEELTAVRTLGDVVLAAGSELYEIHEEQIDSVPHAFGAVHAIARAADGSAYLGTEVGLVARSVDGTYTQYPLSEDGAAPVPVTAVVHDEIGGTYAASALGLVRLHQGELTGIAAGELAHAMAVDRQGDVWLAEDQSLTALFVGTPVSFASEVLPIVAAKCAGCHGVPESGAPSIDWTDFATAVGWSDHMLDRIGDPASPMPPRNASPLSALERALLVRWLENGTAP
ncbi:MAG TPA: hypothetical protein VFB62_02950 [Polyangiaceae bacterium]|nr:hypothetical protein [Polyangiaceae bacterium]